MITVSVLYPKNAESHFDFDYYLQKHMPFVRSLWNPMGLVSDTLLRGSATLDGSSPAYELLGMLAFESIEKVQAALAAHGQEVIADIPNFTNVSPLIQLNVPVS